MPTDNDTSPCEKYVITLLAVPPGHVPTKITPIVNSGDKLNILHSKYAIKGIIVNCATKPTNTSFGFLTIIKKSFGFIVNPIPNITIINK